MNFKTGKTAAERHSPWPAPRSRLRLATRVRLQIMNRPQGFSAIATLNAARARASVRQIASVS
jgi:hypothetical protein